MGRVKNGFNSYPMDRIGAGRRNRQLRDEAYFQQSLECSDYRQPRADDTGAGKNSASPVLPSSANFIFARHPSHAAE